MPAITDPAEAVLDPALSNPKQAWIVLFGSFCTIWSTYGMLASNGVFLEIWAADQLSGLPQDQLTWINAVHVFMTLFLGGLAGILFDRYGLRLLMTVGSILYLAGFFLLAECEEYWHFMLSYGVAAGIGCALLSTVAMAIIPHWFTQNGGLANGIMMMGGSTGGIMFPQIIRILYENLGWTWCIRILSIILTVLIAIGNVCMRGRTTKRVKVEISFKDFTGSKVVCVLLGIACKYSRQVNRVCVGAY
jgi:MFS family permease